MGVCLDEKTLKEKPPRGGLQFDDANGRPSREPTATGTKTNHQRAYCEKEVLVDCGKGVRG